MHGERLFSVGAKAVRQNGPSRDGGRCTGTRCRIVCAKTEAARRKGTCRLGYSRDGRLCVDFTYIDEGGKIVTRRNFGHVVPASVGEPVFQHLTTLSLHNPTTPPILPLTGQRTLTPILGLTLTLRCNNAVELIFTGREAHAVAQYITSYEVKGELASTDMFSILAEDHEKKRKVG